MLGSSDMKHIPAQQKTTILFVHILDYLAALSWVNHSCDFSLLAAPLGLDGGRWPRVCVRQFVLVMMGPRVSPAG